MVKHNLQIDSFEEIRTNKAGNQQMRIFIKDIENQKRVEYIIFEKAHFLLWETILRNETKFAVFPGKIIDVTLNLELINKTKMSYELGSYPYNSYFEKGYKITMVLWEWDKGNTYEDLLIMSLNDQLWKVKKDIDLQEYEEYLREKDRLKAEEDFYKDYNPFTGD